ncbi:MAG: hypothetical protein IJM51_06440 [Clostridia bacterium]|nr:hypothetical protein [Clostridia bacterium]
MKRKVIRTLTVLFVSFSLMMFGGMEAAAATYQPCWVEIPFSVEDVSNEIPKDTAFEVEIKAIGKAPLPDSSTIETEPSGPYTVEKITFDQPGTYTYTMSIRKKDDSDDNIHADENVYTIKVVVIARDDGSLYNTVVIYQNGSQLKSGGDDSNEIEGGSEPGFGRSMIVFRNRYGTYNPASDDSGNGTGSSPDGNDTAGDGTTSSQDGKTDDHAPGTGEGNWMLPAAGAMIGSCLLILSVYFRQFRRRAKEQEEA